MTSRQFHRVRTRGTRRVGKFLHVDFYHGAPLPPKVGLEASRKFGKSHERNDFKRRVREAFRLLQHQLPQGLEIIIRPRPCAIKVSTEDIMNDLKMLLR